MKQKFEIEIDSIRKFSAKDVRFALAYAICAPPKREVKVKKI